MNLSHILNNSLKQVKNHSPEILTGLGVSGVITTSYLVAKASFKAKTMIDERDKEVHGVPRNGYPSTKEQAKLVWKLYIPPVIAGTATIACIIGSQKANSRRTAAAFTAYSLTEKAFTEYKEKVVEQIGKGKEKKIRDEVAKDRIEKNPPNANVMIFGKGEVLCCELWTGRYFKCDMETLRRAENDLNAMIVNTYYVTLDEFYDLIDLPHTSTSDKLGWDSDKLLELQFSPVLSPDGEPCLAFDYNYIRPNHRTIY